MEGGRKKPKGGSIKRCWKDGQKWTVVAVPCNKYQTKKCEAKVNKRRRKEANSRILWFGMLGRSARVL